MQRLHVLRAYHVLDTPPEEEYDDITKLAAQICEVPTAMVTLVDEHRQWFKSKVGLSACEAPRKKDSLCAYATRNTEPLVVEDASKDPRFCDNMLVKGEPHVRFYAGAPLLAPTGEAVGTLCVIDSKPRRLNPQQIEALACLARQVVSLLELRVVNRELEKHSIFQESILQNASSALITTGVDGIISHFNSEAEEMLGYRAEEVVGKVCPVQFHDPAEVAVRAAEMSEKLGHPVEPGIEVFTIPSLEGRGETREWTYIRKDGSRLPVLLSVSVMHGADGTINGYVGVARDLTERKQYEERQRRKILRQHKMLA